LKVVYEVAVVNTAVMLQPNYMKLFSFHGSEFSLANNGTFRQTICLLLQKFSKVWAARRRPGPAQRAASHGPAQPVGLVGPGLVACRLPAPCSSLIWTPT